MHNTESTGRINEMTLAVLADLSVLSQSLHSLPKSTVGILAEKNREVFFSLADPADLPDWWADLERPSHDFKGMKLLTTDRSPKLCRALMEIIPNLRPRRLGLNTSFGFGDRIGLATPGHVAALVKKGVGICPVFAQQSTREMIRTRRSPEEVMADATWGAFRSGWKGILGADADHLKTRADALATAEAGFCFFTLDPSDHVDQQADDYSDSRVLEAFDLLFRQKVTGARDYLSLYDGKTYRLDTGKETTTVTFDELTLKRAAVKYGRGLAFVYDMADYISEIMKDNAYEIEISVDETEQPTAIAEHLFIALELKRHAIPVVSLAPRFVGDFEKGIDYRGNLDVFQKSVYFHAAVAEAYGPYKLSLHSGSDKFSVYPLIGRACRGKVHVKTAGTSYLEALRVIARKEPAFFRQIVEFSRTRFDLDRATYHLSSNLAGSAPPEELADDRLEPVYLDEDNGRQIMHVTFGSVLSETDENGAALFGDDIRNILKSNGDLHEILLQQHLGHHLALLKNEA